MFFFTEQGALKRVNRDGSLVPYWAPNASDFPVATKLTKLYSSSSYTLRDMHTPLEDWKKKITFLHGIDMASDKNDPIKADNEHIKGETHSLVADNRQSSTLAGGISIDQFIAKGINSPSPVTALPSLEVRVDARQGQSGAESAPVYASSGQPVPIVGNAGKIYDRLFPDGPHNPDDIVALQKKIARQKSVLDFAGNDFMSVSKELGTLDRKRLEAHAQSIRDLESRLGLGSNATCIEPERSIIDTATSAGGGTAYEANADVHMRLVTTALACDLTRVVTMYMSQAPDALFGYKPGASSDFHDLVHKTNGEDASLDKDPESMKVVKAYHTYNSKMFAKFLGMLDAIPESDGTTLLDNTVVVWCGQLGGGDHTIDHLPYILGGGLGGEITPGRLVVYPRKFLGGAGWPAYSAGPAHNDLFVSLAQKMGMADVDTFGKADVCTGPIAGLT